MTPYRYTYHALLTDDCRRIKGAAPPRAEYGPTSLADSSAPKSLPESKGIDVAGRPSGLFTSVSSDVAGAGAVQNDLVGGCRMESCI